MGRESKARGTRDERVAQAIERNAAERAERERIAAEREAAMTPAERANRLKVCATLAAFMGGVGVGHLLGEMPLRRDIPLSEIKTLDDFDKVFRGQ